MGRIYGLKCKKCGLVRDIVILVDQYGDVNNNTYFCKDCKDLSIIDIYHEKLVCKNCKSTNITEDKSEYKCIKCGKKEFDRIEEVET
jgi:DNA-directed RNA polymerase subunit RPC12/RpoP